MKKASFLLLPLCALLLTTTQAQQLYRNEWIDYNKTYYKFKVDPFGYDIVGAPIKKGMVRISQPALSAAGLGNVPAEQFQLWRDGAEVPIYISKTTGTLSSTDYIEFFGEIANGKPDRDLYTNPDFQLSDYWSLETDFASYFLAVNPSGTNKRISTVANDLNGNTMPAEKNFMYTAGRYYRAWLNEGTDIGLGVTESTDGTSNKIYLYLSNYESGEGFSSRPIHPNSYYENIQMPQYFGPLYLDTAGPDMTVKYNLRGNAHNEARDVKILMNNDSIAQFSLPYTAQARKAFQGIDANRIKTDDVTLVIQNLCTVTDDEIRVTSIEMDYPRLFNFGGANNFEFNLEASNKGRYIKIANFNKGTSGVQLIDLTNNTRYIANTDIPDTLQFLLQPSPGMYHLVLARTDGSTAKNISGVEQREFIDYTKAQNQGNYIIITNPQLMGSGSQDNYVQQYSDYRSSDSGGHFHVIIADIKQLTDQYAWGVDMHPLAVKNFLKFTRNNFSDKPRYAFIIGKGVSYMSYRIAYYYDPMLSKHNLIPVYGSPGSDNLLASEGYDPVPQTPIGRLSVVSTDEVGTYLKKIKQFESLQRDTSYSIKDRNWFKKALFVGGSNSAADLADTINLSNLKFANIIKDTLFGAVTHNYSITTDPAIAKSDQDDFAKEFNDGCVLMEYLGHSSSSSIDFNLDDPTHYQNYNKYPVFIVNGCLAGNIFDYDAARLNQRTTLSEKFVLEPDRGSIGYLATTSYGLVNYLDFFTTDFYKSVTGSSYNGGMGDIVKNGITNTMSFVGSQDVLGRMHAEQYCFHGDPALQISNYTYPDYAIDSAEMSVTPGYLTIVSDSFNVKFKIRNLGKASTDSLQLLVKRTFPNNSTMNVFDGKIAAVKGIDSFSIKLPIVGNRDKGTTIISAFVNDDNALPEQIKRNNSGAIKIKISAADLFPVSPYNYSIVNSPDIKLVASAANAFDSATQYVLELDTTALYNSPSKITRTTIAKGGLVEFNNIQVILDNTVYYWRVSEDSADKHWNSFSFTYAPTANEGFQQAHFYQHTESSFDAVVLDSATRSFRFGPSYKNLYVLHSIYPTSGTEDYQLSVSIDGTVITWSACVGGSIIFNVFDPLTLTPVLNTTLPYGSGAICDPTRKYNFEYSTQYSSTRKNAMDFLDYYVQNGYYVLARKIYDLGNADWAPTVWAKDTSIYGHNNSLYHRLKEQGTLIDSFTYPRTFVFFFKKNDQANYQTRSVLSQGLYDKISLSEAVPIADTSGYVTSPEFGPGKSWHRVLWHGSSINKNNSSSLNVFAVDTTGKDTLLYTIDTAQHELDISAINAATYPYVKLQMKTSDSLTAQPYQLKDWTVEFTPVPEGAIAANLGSNIPDTCYYGHGVNVAYDSLKGYVVFKNISNTSFDPLKINVKLYDINNNLIMSIPVAKTRPLPAGDTIHVSFLTNATTLPEGTYNLYIEVNPDNDQPEQYHYNNFFYKYIYISREIVLASHLFDLSATALSGYVQLKWNVTNELNAAYYIAEHSSNGRDFKEIGKVNATSVITTVKYYGLIHTSPVAGKNYYRIKMIDKNGAYSYSPVRIVVIGNINIKVYPNPFKDQLKVIMNGSTVNGTIRLLDLSGRILLQQKFTGNSLLNTGKLSSGMYLLQVSDGAAIQIFKVSKQ